MIFFILLGNFSLSQKGFQLEADEKVTIPFKFINNLIFIPIKVNGVELNFLLDSGVNETIMFGLNENEVEFKNTEKIKFSGLGENIDIEGLKTINNQLQIHPKFFDNSHTLYIILNQEINFSDHIGVEVNGVIGYHFFANYPIKIDFKTKKITVFKPSKKWDKQIKNFEKLPLSIEQNKPYLQADVEVSKEKNNSKLLLDLGNSDALWLFPSVIQDFIYKRPHIDDYLGRGFNGEIFGKRNRIHGLYFGSFKFDKPLSAMPDAYSIQHLKLVANRKGSIGNEILRRFTLLFDYQNSSIYLRKNSDYNAPFLFNKSGLDIKHDGMNWEADLVKVQTSKKDASHGIELWQKQDNFQYKFVLKPQFSIAGCRKDSPCSQAGLKAGDKILSIGSKKANVLTLEKINYLLKASEDGYKLKIRVERNTEVLDFYLILEDPIPYQD